MSRKTISHPDFVYRPMTAAQRQRMSDAARARLGIPLGYRRLYGALVPDAIFPEVQKRMHQLRRTTGDKTLLRYYVRMLVGKLMRGRKE